MHEYKYPRPAVAVDLVLFGLQEHKLVVLVGQRSAAPFKGRTCLPGTYVRETESAANACDRKISSIGLEHTYLEQLFTFTEPKRDPRERVVSIAHYGLVPIPKVVPSGDDKIDKLAWVEPGSKASANWAFDHLTILDLAVQRLRANTPLFHRTSSKTNSHFRT
jgi:8-oxo-dGTP diphosphatase